MIRHLLILVALPLACASSARAALTTGTTGWLSGAETQNLNLECPNTATATISTSLARSGAASLAFARSGSTTGTCGMVNGLNLTGTIVIMQSFYFGSIGACTSEATGGNVADFGEVKIGITCADSTNNYVVHVTENSSEVSSANPTFVNGQWYTVAVKIVTGAGSGSVEWRYTTDGINWTDPGCGGAGGCTGRTITNVSQLVYAHWKQTQVASFATMNIDDIVALVNPGVWPPEPRTFVNMRNAKSSTPTYDNWTKTGGSGTIWTIWDQDNPLTSGCCAPSEYAGNTVATSTDLGQTAKFNDWDAGTPTPVIPASAAGVTQIWGCRWDAYAARGGGTNRTYAYRAYWQGAADDSTFGSLTLSASAWTLAQMMFDISSASVPTELTDLKALELGGTKVSTASGAPMLILDEWLQCAWSESASTVEDMWTN